MANTAKPLDTHQQELINVVKLAHTNLATARRLRVGEAARRRAEAKIASDRALEAALAEIELDVDATIEQHGAALDQALIAAYNSGIPIARIATDGFGNRYPGGVNQLLVKLREEGMLGSRVDYQRNTTDPDEIESRVEFPKVADVEGLLADRLGTNPVQFVPIDGEYELLAADSAHNQPAITAKAVRIVMDERDPYFKEIAKNARPGTRFRYATETVVYFHPSTGNLVSVDSDEPGLEIWDHPVARWVKDHYDEAFAGAASALGLA